MGIPKDTRKGNEMSTATNLKETTSASEDKALEHSTNISINVVTIFAGAMAFIVGFSFKAILEHAFLIFTEKRWLRILMWIVAMGIAVSVSLAVNGSLRTHYETLDTLNIRKECREITSKMMSLNLDLEQKEILYQSMQDCDEKMINEAKQSYRCSKLEDRHNRSKTFDDGLAQKIDSYTSCHNFRRLKRLESCRNHVIHAESLRDTNAAKEYMDKTDFEGCGKVVLDKVNAINKCINIYENIENDMDLASMNIAASCFNKNEIDQMMKKEYDVGLFDGLDGNFDIE